MPVPPLPAAELDLTLEAPESPTGRRVATEPAAAAPVAVVERGSIAGSHGIASAAVAEDSRAPDAVVAPTDQGTENLRSELILTNKTVDSQASHQ